MERRSSDALVAGSACDAPSQSARKRRVSGGAAGTTCDEASQLRPATIRFSPQSLYLWQRYYSDKNVAAP